MRGMRTTFALLLAVAGNAQAGTADCDGDAARVLHAAAHAATDARAYWLDGTRIRWPAQPADARYRLVASSSAGLRVERGQAVAGADRSYLLQASHDLPDAVAARFRFVGEGATLRSCVLFDGCAIAAGAQLTDAIVTPEGVFQCAPSEDAP